MIRYALMSLPLLIAAGSACAQESPVVHDAEFNVLEAQNGERWRAEDEAIDARLAEIREKNGGKPPNIIYILLDDVGFGELGMPNLSVTRGYKTPTLDALAREGLSLQRMYTEPSCTPTRVAMMTGRHPVRTRNTRSEDVARWRWPAGRGGHHRRVTQRSRLRHVSRGQVAHGRHRRGIRPQAGVHAC